MDNAFKLFIVSSHGGAYAVFYLNSRHLNDVFLFSYELCKDDWPYIQVYTASKVKHRLNIFIEKTVNLFKHELILVTFLKRD